MPCAIGKVDRMDWNRAYAEAAFRPRPREPPVTTMILPLREKRDGKSWRAVSLAILMRFLVVVKICFLWGRLQAKGMKHSMKESSKNTSTSSIHHQDIRIALGPRGRPGQLVIPMVGCNRPMKRVPRILVHLELGVERSRGTTGISEYRA